MAEATFVFESVPLATIIGIAVFAFLAVAAVIVALLVFAGTRPSSFRVERTALVSAPGDVVFPIINDLHRWDQWSPWDKLDPSMKKTFEGPAAGPGSSFAWVGNSKAGAGRCSILDSRAGDFVSIELEMFKPFAATNQVKFVLQPADPGARVTWSMEGKKNFIVKVFCLFTSMDAMVGKQFEEGLANLNKLAQEEMLKISQADSQDQSVPKHR